ncbi:TPA: hypothetical protein EYP44_00105 [Candidatus Bathyarchaeota archaeon]|nr:hypothetical protein [Candidatus Bathyarchaeota archaeon]
MVYWVINPSLLRELIGLLEEAVAGRVVLPEVVLNFVFLFACLLDIRFVAWRWSARWRGTTHRSSGTRSMP